MHVSTGPIDTHPVGTLAAILTPAALRGSVAIVTGFAVLASVPVGVIQALEADARV